MYVRFIDFYISDKNKPAGTMNYTLVLLLTLTVLVSQVSSEGCTYNGKNCKVGQGVPQPGCPSCYCKSSGKVQCYGAIRACHIERFGRA